MVFTCFTLLMPAFSLLPAPAVLPVDLLRWQNAPLPITLSRNPMASVSSLAPLSFPRRITRPVSYYALFKGWLLLSQPPGCQNNPTSFSTELELEDLSRWSGFFPSRLRISLPAVALPRSGVLAFGVWFGLVTDKAPSQSSALPPTLNTRRCT